MALCKLGIVMHYGTLKLGIVMHHGTQDQSLYVEFPATVYSFMQKSTFYGTWLLHSRNTCFGSDFSTKKREKNEPQKSLLPF